MGASWAPVAPHMTVMLLAVALLPIVIGLYAYVLYPLLLRILARPSTDVGRAPEAHPLVTIVVVAYNEEQQIRGSIEGLLEQDYPAARRQILIVSDASTDRTHEIVRSYSSRGVELLCMPVRGGKTAAENAAVALIRGEIVVNTDASARLERSAVSRLVRALQDPAVGVASTRNVIVTGGLTMRTAEESYTGYEMRIRSLETRAGGTIGSAGSGYAIRTELHRHRVRDDLSRDFSSALIARRYGMRAALVDDAICFVPRTTSLRREYRRKVRTISRGMETLYFNRDLLNPLRHGRFAWKLFSHKLCRWLLPVSVVPGIVAVLLLVSGPGVRQVLLAGMAAGAAFAALGARWPEDRSVPRWLPMALLGALAANLAVLHSAWRFFHGHEDHVWEPTRRAPVPT